MTKIFIHKINPVFNEFDMWEMKTDDLANHFKEKYFGKDAEGWWVADEIGGVYFINDYFFYFFDLDDMVNFLRHKYPKKIMFKYYDYALEMRTKNKTPMNIKTWLSDIEK